MERFSGFAEEALTIFPNLVLLVIKDKGGASRKDMVLDFFSEAGPDTLNWGADLPGGVKGLSESTSLFLERRKHKETFKNISTSWRKVSQRILLSFILNHCPGSLYWVVPEWERLSRIFYPLSFPDPCKELSGSM